MKIDTNLDGLEPLRTDELTYKWKYQKIDSDWTYLTEEDANPYGESLLVNGFDMYSKILVAKYPHKLLGGVAGEKDQGWNYACEITNTIHGATKDEKATLDTATEYTFTFI